jgi:glycosyltransferase involved in cell wall biosynthesis
VGSVDEKCENLKELPKKLGIQEFVTFYGRVSFKKFITLMGEMDVCVALRFPTMGETSAIIMRAMQIGLPVVVSDIGWYSELPEFIHKVPVKNVETHLYDILNRFIKKGAYLKSIKVKLTDWMKNELNYTENTRKYHNILIQIFRDQLNRSLYRIMGEVFNDLDLIEYEKGQLAKKTIDTVKDIF